MAYIHRVYKATNRESCWQH